MRASLVLVVGLLLGVDAQAAASEARVDDLLRDPASHSGEEVTVTGELVGDFQRRGDHVWVQLNDDAYVWSPIREGGAAGSNIGIGVRLPASLFDAYGLHHPGGYRYRGPIVRATGQWRFRDEGRGGESYLAVTSFEVVERERLLHDEMSVAVLVTGAILLAIGVGAPLVTRRRGR